MSDQMTSEFDKMYEDGRNALDGYILEIKGLISGKFTTFYSGFTDDFKHVSEWGEDNDGRTLKESLSYSEGLMVGRDRMYRKAVEEIRILSCKVAALEDALKRAKLSATYHREHGVHDAIQR